jgi:hypothetical protein
MQHARAVFTRRASCAPRDLAALGMRVRSGSSDERTAGQVTLGAVPPPRHRASHVFHVLVLLLGGLGLGIAIYQLGWDGMRRVILGTGTWFGLIALVDLLSAGCDAFAIHGFLRPKMTVSYWAVFAAQASGIAVNRLTPGNSLGEPVKVTMLTTRHVPTSLAVSAIVMFNLATIYVGVTVLVIGVPLTALLLDLPHRIAVIVWLATGLLVVLAIASVVLIKRGAVGTLIGAIAGTRLLSKSRAKAWRGKIADIDTRLRDLLGNTRTSGLRRGLAGVVASRVLNWCGTITVLHAADIPLTPTLVIATLSVGVIVTWASNIVPLGLGIADGANYVLYGLLGASSSAGLVFTMINRLRTVMLAMMGLAVMAIAHTTHRLQLRREPAT